MDKLKTVTIIFLLAVGLFTSTAQAKSASVMLQEGLYAEEIEGDLDAAIKVYEEIIAKPRVDKRVAAQAMYRLGMCYTKKQNGQKARETFEKLLRQYPKQKTIIEQVRPLLDEMRYSDPAELMPADTAVAADYGDYRPGILVNEDNGLDDFTQPHAAGLRGLGGMPGRSFL